MSPDELRREDDARMAVFDSEIKHIIENQRRYEEEARDWRDRFCKKLDVIMERMDNRPCVRHDALLSSVKSQLGWMWAVTGAVVVAIITEWVQGHGK